jgi:hypothetical protein
MADAPLMQLPRLVKVPGGEPNLDVTIEGVIAEEAASPSAPEAGMVRIRLQPDVYSWASRSYVSMRGVTWAVDMHTDQAKRFRGALHAFLVGWIEQEALAGRAVAGE